MPKHLHEIRDPIHVFVRLDTDRSRKGGGSGLGLAIVAEIIRAHHGGISIGDRQGGGARITVTLPSGQ